MFSRLPIVPVGTKLRIAYALLVLIIVGFAGAYYVQTKESVAFSAKEVVGNDYITVVRPLLSFIPQHRGTTNAMLAGNDKLA